MNSFCQDRDLLLIEPTAFLSGGFAHQQILTGSDGVFSGTGFQSAGADFLAAGVSPGMVLVTTHSIGEEGSAWEIVSVNSATDLTISVLRGSTDDAPTAPPADSGLTYFIRSFAAQIADASQLLDETLRRLGETTDLSAANLVDSEQLRRITCYNVLASVFRARSEYAGPTDLNWIKSEYYAEESRRLRSGLCLASDLDGDGIAESTRSPGHVTLRRV